MANQHNDRATDTEVAGENAQHERRRSEHALPSQDSTASPSTERRSRTTDANELGPDVGPGRRATDRPVSPPAKSLQRLAVVALVVGLTAGFLLVSADGVNRFLGLGLAFSLVVWLFGACWLMTCTGRLPQFRSKTTRSAGSWRAARNLKTGLGNSANPTNGMPVYWRRLAMLSSGAIRTVWLHM